MLFIRIRLQDSRCESERATGDYKGVADIEQAGDDHATRAEKVLDKRQRKTADIEPADIDHRKGTLVLFLVAADQINEEHRDDGAQKADCDNQEKGRIPTERAEGVDDCSRKRDIQENERDDLVIFRVFENQFFEHISQNDDQDKRQCLEQDGTHEWLSEPGKIAYCNFSGLRKPVPF